MVFVEDHFYTAFVFRNGLLRGTEKPVQEDVVRLYNEFSCIIKINKKMLNVYFYQTEILLEKETRLILLFFVILILSKMSIFC